MPPASRARPSCWSPTSRGSPRTPIAKSIVRDGKVHSLTAERVGCMIRFGLRLAVAGGREAVTRLIVIAAAVAIGVGAAVDHAGRRERGQRPDRAVRMVHAAGPTGAAPIRSSWRPRRLLPRRGHRPGRCRRHRARRSGPARPSAAARPGRVLRLAGPATSCCRPPRPTSSATASPATRSAAIGDAALPSPDTLAGRRRPHQPAELAAMPDIRKVSAFRAPTTSIALSAAGFDLVLSVGGRRAALPDADASSARRRGCPPRGASSASRPCAWSGRPHAQITVLSTVEAAMSAVAGTVVGFVLFFALRSTFAADPVHRPAVLHLRSRARAARPRRRGHRHPRRRRCVSLARAAAGEHLAARGQPPGHPEAAACLAAHPARAGAGRARPTSSAAARRPASPRLRRSCPAA